MVVLKYIKYMIFCVHVVKYPDMYNVKIINLFKFIKSNKLLEYLYSIYSSCDLWFNLEMLKIVISISALILYKVD